MRKRNYQPDNEINRMFKANWDFIRKWGLIIGAGVAIGLLTYYGTIYIDSLMLK